MDTILFNFHDLLMVVTAFECLLLATLLAASARTPSLSNALLVAFLLCHFLIPLHELMFWGKLFRIWLLDISPDLFFIFSFAYYLDGPLLYFFVRALLYKDIQLKPKHSWHLLPLALYVLHMLVSFYLQPDAVQRQLIETQHIAYSSPHLYVETLGRFVRMGYVLWCFMLVWNYRQQLRHEQADLKTSDVAWLKIMLLSFLLIFALDTVLVCLKLYGFLADDFDMDLLNVVGLSSYYLNFVALNILIFLRFTSFVTVAPVSEQPLFEAKDESAAVFDQQIALRLEQLMREQKFYANPDITLDKLAAAAGYPAKKVSLTIKQCHQQNFYEYVNSYRIAQAKLLLAEQGPEAQTITDIYFAVGFNSKSVFNTFFKRLEGVTPSQYRDQQNP
ncbi:helix-turn-helix domain-containing protein [Rheinheimera marina]|uniref:Helix-turn-helix domain-containing protein n=1 Tax=Rheinheimera marina TaxID=1774958 RepID=A0ABV9JRB1_9GAMM